MNGLNWMLTCFLELRTALLSFGLISSKAIYLMLIPFLLFMFVQVFSEFVVPVSEGGRSTEDSKYTCLPAFRDATSKITFIQYIDKHSPNYTASHTGRRYFFVEYFSILFILTHCYKYTIHMCKCFWLATPNWRWR